MNTGVSLIDLFTNIHLLAPVLRTIIFIFIIRLSTSIYRHSVQLISDVVWIFTIKFWIWRRRFWSYFLRTTFLYLIIGLTYNSMRCWILHVTYSSIFDDLIWHILLIWRKSVGRCSSLNGKVSQSSTSSRCISPSNRASLARKLPIRYVHSPLYFRFIWTTNNLLICEFSICLHNYLILERISHHLLIRILH